MKKIFDCRRLIIKCLLIMGIMIGSNFVTNNAAYAAKTTLVSTHTTTIYEEDNIDERPNYKKISFSLSKEQYVKLNIKAWPEFYCITLRLKLTDSNGTIYANDKIDDFFEDDEYYDSWFVPDGYIKLPAGDYTYKFTNLDTENVKVKYSIVAYDSNATSATVYKSKSVYGGNVVKIGYLPKSQYPNIKDISMSNSKILDGWYIDSNGNIYVEGWKSGTATATVKLFNGKRYKCKIKVKAGDPNYFAQLIEYNTRNNYFKVRFKNLGPEKIKIYSSNSKSMDVDYKSYDRKLYIKGHNSITIPAGKTKTVKFYIKGDTTWPDYKDHTIRYYFTHNGKKYLGSVWHDGSSYKYNKKWWTTYWSGNKSSYNGWLK